MLHKTSSERYGKLKMHFRRLMENFNVDDLEDFILTVNSLPVWMENDPSLVQEQRDALARFTVDGSLDWQICNQIANRQKHVRPQRQGGPALRVNSVQVANASSRNWRSCNFRQAERGCQRICRPFPLRRKQAAATHVSDFERQTPWKTNHQMQSKRFHPSKLQPRQPSSPNANDWPKMESRS